MKSQIAALFLAITTLLPAAAPPNVRPDTPLVSLIRIVEIATATAREIDASAYAGEASFRYAYMSPAPDEFSKDRWEVVFYRPKQNLTDSGFPDIVIAVTLDGEKTRVIKK
jgi:hypothetical protein